MAGFVGVHARTQEILVDADHRGIGAARGVADLCANLDLGTIHLHLVLRDIRLKKDWWLAAGVTVLTVTLALGLIRLFAPQLLGGARDLQLVRASKEVPPFFENVFRRKDYESLEFIIQDPYVKRAKPLFPEEPPVGPHDILGFRNRAIPNIADIVVIGDSQTYGNHAILADNWPSQLQAMLSSKQPVVYSMAVGGWSATEYLAMFNKALLFKPQVIVVAFYTGNDALETFIQAYGNDYYAFLRLNPKLDARDAPKVTYPAPESEWWKVAFKDGVKTIFTPKLRYAANQDHPAIRAGYAIMVETGRLMREMAQRHPVKLVFTIIPTKELVYAAKVAQEGLESPADYATLITEERKNARRLADDLRKIPDVTVVDLIDPLQEAAKNNIPLYPNDTNGHPVAAGYQVIARTLSSIIEPFLSPRLEGLAAVRQDETRYQVFLVRDSQVWLVPAPDIARQNGWTLGDIPLVEERLIWRLPLAGSMDQVDTERFGPR